VSRRTLVTSGGRDRPRRQPGLARSLRLVSVTTLAGWIEVLHEVIGLGPPACFDLETSLAVGVRRPRFRARPSADPGPPRGGFSEVTGTAEVRR